MNKTAVFPEVRVFSRSLWVVGAVIRFEWAKLAGPGKQREKDENEVVHGLTVTIFFDLHNLEGHNLEMMKVFLIFSTLVTLSCAHKKTALPEDDLVTVKTALDQAQMSYLRGCVESFVEMKKSPSFPHCVKRAQAHRAELDEIMSKDLKDLSSLRALPIDQTLPQSGTPAPKQTP